MIFIGYQGIGKSTLAGKKAINKCIDLESGNFWVNGKRADDWYVPYCNIALDLSSQGYNVFTSSHNVVREYLGEVGGEKIAIIKPAYELKDEWIGRLKERYESSKLDKDFKAWKNAEDRYETNIEEMVKDAIRYGFYTITIEDMNYDLRKIVKHFVRDVTGENVED